MDNSFNEDFNEDFNDFNDFNDDINVIKCISCREKLKLTNKKMLNKKIHLCIDDNKYYHKSCYNYLINLKKGLNPTKLPKYGQFNEL